MVRRLTPYTLILAGLLPLVAISCATTHRSAEPNSASETRGAAAAERKESARLLEQGNQYARDGLYREALATFDQFFDKHPEDPSANRTVGIIYVKMGAYKKALQYLDKAFTYFPNNYDLNFYYGEALRMQAHYGDAIYHYKRALEAEPKNVPALKALTWSFYSIRYYVEALRSAKELKKLVPNDFQAAIITARVLNKINLNDKAMAILNRTENTTNADNIPFLNSVKGDILYSMGEKEAAEQAYRKALQDQPLLPGALIGLGKKLLDDRKPETRETAITYLDRAVKIRPNMVEAYYLLGKAYKETNPEKSIAYYRIFSKEAYYDPGFQQELAEIRPQLLEAKKKIDAKRGVSSRGDGDEQL